MVAPRQLIYAHLVWSLIRNDTRGHVPLHPQWVHPEMTQPLAAAHLCFLYMYKTGCLLALWRHLSIIQGFGLCNTDQSIDHVPMWYLPCPKIQWVSQEWWPYTVLVFYWQNEGKILNTWVSHLYNTFSIMFKGLFYLFILWLLQKQKMLYKWKYRYKPFIASHVVKLTGVKHMAHPTLKGNN